jgi:hypothetical protein
LTGRTGFEETRARYGELVGEDEGRGSEIDACYREYAPLSEIIRTRMTRRKRHRPR